eukprot:3095033-Amphidinium_carterae.1
MGHLEPTLISSDEAKRTNGVSFCRSSRRGFLQGPLVLPLVREPRGKLGCTPLLPLGSLSSSSSLPLRFGFARLFLQRAEVSPLAVVGGYVPLAVPTSHPRMTQERGLTIKTLETFTFGSIGTDGRLANC